MSTEFSCLSRWIHGWNYTWLGPKVGGRLALVCIHHVNRVNSDMITINISLVLLLLYICRSEIFICFLSLLLQYWAINAFSLLSHGETKPYSWAVFVILYFYPMVRKTDEVHGLYIGLLSASSVIANCCDITSLNCDIKNSNVLSILDVENSSWY